MLVHHRDDVTSILLEKTEDWRIEQKKKAELAKVTAAAAASRQKTIKTDAPGELGSPLGSPRLFEGSLGSPVRLPPKGMFYSSPARTTGSPGKGKR